MVGVQASVDPPPVIPQIQIVADLAKLLDSPRCVISKTLNRLVYPKVMAELLGHNRCFKPTRFEHTG